VSSGTGAPVSEIITFCSTGSVGFPEASVKIQKIDPEVSNVKSVIPVVPVIIPSQLSIVVAGVTVNGHADTTSGKSGIFGACLSLTVTSWVAVFVLSALSVTVQVTVVIPSGKLAGASLVTSLTPHLSLVVARPRFTFEAVHSSGSVSTETFAGA